MIVCYERVSELPAQWDEAAGDNPYLKREFLAFMDTADDSVKRYYAVAEKDGRLQSVFMTCVRRKYNLAMFTKRRFRITVTMVYLPLSVTRAGIAYERGLEEAAAFVKKIRGYKIFLNLPDVPMPGYAKGLTCPKCSLQIRWKSFDEYMAALRSNYRYRFRKALKKSAALSVRYLRDGAEFTDDMYKLYERVYDKSQIRVEKLSKIFFTGKFFDIFVLEEGDVPRGFVQLMANGDELVFEFVGIDYSVNARYDTYLAMLLEIVRYGIANGFKSIDFGQTADDTKLKLGCKYEYLYAYLHHKNPFLNALCKKLAPRLQYRPLQENFDVFREET